VTPEDAEEYTQALAQIGAGWWRQRVLAIRLGVPEALGQTVMEWAEGLGAGVRLAIPERREAVMSLTGPPEDGGLDLTNREAAAVLGIGVGTVSRDQHADPFGSPDGGGPDQDVPRSDPFGSAESWRPEEPHAQAEAQPDGGADPVTRQAVDPTHDDTRNDYSDRELVLWEQLQNGQTVVVSLRDDTNLIKWAEACSLLVRIDRRSDWGNPFEMPADGDRATVIAHYEQHYLPYKPSLLARLGELQGKALCCWCAPEPCHGDVLKRRADGGADDRG
jgi:hypothetical protein